MCISNNDVGNKIRTLRKAKSLTQQELADAAGFNVQTIRSYEAGKYRPKMETLSKLASALDCTIFDLLGNLEDYPLEDQKDLIIYGGQKAKMNAMYDQLNYDEREKVNAYVADMLTIHEHNASYKKNAQE